MGRIIIVILLLAFISCNTKTGDSFTVDGTIKNSQASYIYIEQNLANRERPLILDSARIEKDGRFHLTVTTKEEGLYSLRAGRAELPFAVLINDSKKLTINADLHHPGDYTVAGSPASESLIKFDKTVGQQLAFLSKYSKRYDSLGHVPTNDVASKKMLDSLRTIDSLGYMTTAREMKNYVLDLGEKNNSPALIIYAVSTFQQIAERYGVKGLNPTEISAIVNKASSRFPDNTTIQEWKKTLRPGKAPQFTLADTSGRPFSLDSLKGRYVLIDFWASWCKPCRMENPNVVAAYNQFRDKNFTILGVSLDDNRNAWLNAIKTDSLAWHHVTDLKRWESPVAAAYGVNSIPYNFLLDPQGNIIAEDISGKELWDALNEHVK